MYKFCDSPWTTVNIVGDGNVRLCLCPGWQNKGFIGNLNEQSLKEMFASPWMQDFRQSIFDQTFRYCQSNACGKMWNLDAVENFDQVANYPELPTTLYFQSLDNNCNLTCASCRTKNIWSKEANPRAEKILTQLIQVYRDFDQPVLLGGDGSGDVFASTAYLNFLNNPDLPECFRFAFNTNGNLLTKNLPMLERLKDRFTSLCVSFDAGRAGTYKQIRGGNFDIVKRGVEQVIELGIPVTTQFVVQAGNYREILEYLEMSQGLGASYIGLQTIRRWTHMTQDWWRANTIEHSTEIDYDWLIPALQHFKSQPNTGIDGGLETLIASRKVP